MHTMLKFHPQRIRLAAATALLFGTCSLSPVANSADISTQLYNQSSIISPLAPKSLMLGVAEAGTNLIAVGERGFILLSQDDGHSWQQIQSPVSVTLTRVTFPTPTEGWAIGHAGVVLHSTDAGLTWGKQLDGVQIATIELSTAEKIYNDDPSDANERNLRIAKRLVEEGPDKPLLDIHFFDSQRGIVVGAYGLALSTEDGGQSWTSISSNIDNPFGLHIYAIAEINNTLYLAGEQGLLLVSNDGGEHFTVLESPSIGTLFGIEGLDNGSLLTFGLRGSIYRSEDQGRTWSKVENRLPVTITAGEQLKDGSILLVDESGRTLVSTDYGRSFNVTPIPKPTYLTNLFQTEQGNLVLTGLSGPVRLERNNSNRGS